MTTTAHKRPRKTRTKRVSARTPLAISALPPQHVDLRPGAGCLVCPDCATWCPITGHHGANPTLVPHDDRPAGEPGARPCNGSRRRVILDIGAWGRQLTEGIADTRSRTSSRVTRKPRVPAPAPVSRMRPAPVTAADAWRACTAHRANCSTCTGRTRCARGQQLDRAYLTLRRQAPKQDAARERARSDRQYAAQATKTNRAEWARQAKATTDPATLAKRSGTAVEDANNLRRPTPAGVVPTQRGLQVPTD